jgi:hypothetical protein
MFLERKLIINFLTYSRLLEESARIVCLLLVLLRLRIIVISKNDAIQNPSTSLTGALNESILTSVDQRSEQLDLSKTTTLYKNLSGNAPQTPNVSLLRKPSNLGEMPSESISQAPTMHPAFSFVDDFVTQNDLKQF